MRTAGMRFSNDQARQMTHTRARARVCEKARNMCAKSYFIHVTPNSGSMVPSCWSRPTRERWWQQCLLSWHNSCWRQWEFHPQVPKGCNVGALGLSFTWCLSLLSLGDPSWRKYQVASRKLLNSCTIWPGVLDKSRITFEEEICKYVDEWFLKAVGVPKATSGPPKYIQIIVLFCPSLVHLSYINRGKQSLNNISILLFLLPYNPSPHSNPRDILKNKITLLSCLKSFIAFSFYLE